MLAGKLDCIDGGLAEMTYYILTKRSAPSDTGKLHHSVHGITHDVWTARAWFRATRVTDVVVLDLNREPDPTEIAGFNVLISDTRLESWREQQLRQELEASRMPIPAH